MLGQTIRSIRRRRRLTQADVAAISGIAQANVSAIERGRRVPNIATLAQLLDACGAELVAVVGDTTFPIGGNEEAVGGLGTPPPRDWSDEKRARMLVAVLQVSEAIVRAR